MSIVGISMWYADAGKHLADRVMHLFRKVNVDRWVFSIRPSNDSTQFMLSAIADRVGVECELFVEPEEQLADRLPRLSAAGDAALEFVRESDDYVLWHESDLFSPPDIAVRLGDAGCVGAGSIGAIGGWPWLSHCPHHPGLGIKTPHHVLLNPPMFYDTWGYRKDGVRFGNQPPHHECHTADRPFRLDSVGSVVLVDASYIRRGARMHGNGLVGLCDDIRRLGGEVWCDPTVPVVQPVELWNFNND
jgi:hypothetical protein